MTLLATLFTIFVLVLLFLLEGPKMHTAAFQLMSPERAAFSVQLVP